MNTTSLWKGFLSIRFARDSKEQWVSCSALLPLSKVRNTRRFSFDPSSNFSASKKGNYVRVKVGLYEGDLGRVTRTGKNNLQLALVPRISLDLTKTKE